MVITSIAEVGRPWWQSQEAEYIHCSTGGPEDPPYLMRFGLLSAGTGGSGEYNRRASTAYPMDRCDTHAKWSTENDQPSLSRLFEDTCQPQSSTVLQKHIRSNGLEGLPTTKESRIASGLAKKAQQRQPHEAMAAW